MWCIYGPHFVTTHCQKGLRILARLCLRFFTWWRHVICWRFHRTFLHHLFRCDENAISVLDKFASSHGHLHPNCLTKTTMVNAQHKCGMFVLRRLFRAKYMRGRGAQHMVWPIASWIAQCYCLMHHSVWWQSIIESKLSRAMARYVAVGCRGQKYNAWMRSTICTNVVAQHTKL